MHYSTTSFQHNKLMFGHISPNICDACQGLANYINQSKYSWVNKQRRLILNANRYVLKQIQNSAKLSTSQVVGKSLQIPKRSFFFNFWEYSEGHNKIRTVISLELSAMVNQHPDPSVKAEPLKTLWPKLIPRWSTGYGRSSYFPNTSLEENWIRHSTKLICMVPDAQRVESKPPISENSNNESAGANLGSLVSSLELPMHHNQLRNSEKGQFIPVTCWGFAVKDRLQGSCRRNCV